jgi:uncharacterized membrane protein
MQKNYKTMIMPIISVLLLGIGTFIGLTQDQIDSLKDATEAIVTAAFTIYGIVGVIMSHRKK